MDEQQQEKKIDASLKEVFISLTEDVLEKRVLSLTLEKEDPAEIVDGLIEEGY